MRVAIIGSRTLTVDNPGAYLPPGTDEIVSGGARGVDACARSYARAKGLKLTEFLPDYQTYSRSAPLRRNLQIVSTATWSGLLGRQEPGTASVLRHCKRLRGSLQALSLPIPCLISARSICSVRKKAVL